ncbi:MAG TPA: aldo/keto reductase [candidate division Zixibacteria bacterium]|nr:aldo/keto reductase [candidate division Zixibacteria bacterium]
MKTRFLGNSGVRVSELCFGAMTFGGRGYWTGIGQVQQKEADALVNGAIEGGINFFDTADVYSEGWSEEILAKALGSRRKDIVLATKVRGRTGPGPNDVGLSRRHIVESCEGSLRRLNTDYIDLYQVHSFDPRTPLEETLRALDDLVRQGKVRYIGVSNFTGWQLMKALAISEKQNLEKFVTLQAFYSLISRDLENELVPLSLDQNLGILPWSPLGGGFLTGKYRRGKRRPEGARRSDPTDQFLQFDEEKGFDIVDELERIAKDHKATITQAALNYLLRKPGVTSVIIGVKTKEQLADNLKASDWEMTPEEVGRLDELSPPPRAYPYWMLERLSKDR